MKFYIKDFKVVRTIKYPVPWYRRWFSYFFKPQVDVFHYDVEFRTRMIEYLKPSQVIMTDACYTLLINKIDRGLVTAQTTGFIADTDINPTMAVVMGQAFSEGSTEPA
jgi:hypothetical protein